MKKSNIALAALALIASTAAMADGVTVYGRLDVSAARISGQATQLNHSNWDTSVFGLKGTEDLGNGMKASFNLEGGLNSTSGEVANNGSAAGVFNRLANVNLSGEFGSVGLGLQFSPFVGAALNGVATGNESFYVPMLVLANGYAPTTYGSTATGGFFVANAVTYTSPSVGGLTASVMTQLANSGAASKPDSNKYDALAINYAAGDLSVAAGYEKNGTLGAKNMTVSAAYNMGPARIAGGFISNNSDGATETVNTVYVGGSYALLPNLTGSLNFAQNNATTKKQLTVAGLQYTLSKRSYLYTTIGRGTNGASPLYGTAQTAGTSATGYAVGVVHNF